MSPRVAIAGIGGLFAVALAATPLVVEHEGSRLSTYADPVGIPTVCEGVTKGVRAGMTFTREECDAKTAAALLEHAVAIRPCLPASLPAETHAAFLSFAYNVGAAKFCSSTMARKAKAGDLAGACDELPRWVYAGGKAYPGLVRRRAAERALCVKGLAS